MKCVHRVQYCGVNIISNRCVVLQEGAKQIARLVTLVICNKGLLIRAA